MKHIMSKYKEVDSIFGGLDRFVVDSKSLIERPFYDEGAFIEGQMLKTLDDGMEIELCLWRDCDWHISLWDVSIDKKKFPGKGKEDFLNYLMEKGFYLENVQDKFGKWKYCGIIEKDDVYRIQYYEEEEEI